MIGWTAFEAIVQLCLFKMTTLHSITVTHIHVKIFSDPLCAIGNVLCCYIILLFNNSITNKQRVTSCVFYHLGWMSVCSISAPQHSSKLSLASPIAKQRNSESTKAQREWLYFAFAHGCLLICMSHARLLNHTNPLKCFLWREQQMWRYENYSSLTLEHSHWSTQWKM